MRTLIMLILLIYPIYAGFPRPPVDEVMRPSKWMVSLDEATTALDQWLKVTNKYRCTFGLSDPKVGIPNETELFCYLLALRQATGKLTHERQYGVVHFDPSSRTSSWDHAAWIATQVVLDTFRKWLEENPKELEKYKLLVESKRTLKTHADRSVGQIDYAAFSKVLCVRITPEGYTPEYTEMTYKLLEQFRTSYFSPEKCQASEEDWYAEQERVKRQENKLAVEKNSTNIFTGKNE